MAVAFLLGLLGQRVAVNYLSRDRWGFDPLLLAGTQYQFGTAEFYVFNETGREVIVSVSAGGRILFVRRLPAKLRLENGRQRYADRNYSGRYPYAHLHVQQFDVLTRSLELVELPGGRNASVDLESLPKNEGGDFSIRVTALGFIVRRATYGFS